MNKVNKENIIRRSGYVNVHREHFEHLINLGLSKKENLTISF